MQVISKTAGNNFIAIKKPLKKYSLASFCSNTGIKVFQKDSFVKSNLSFSGQLNKDELMAQTIAKTGYIAFKTKDYQGCIDILDKALEYDTQDAKIYHTKASAQRELGLFKEAIENYTKATEINPNAANSYNLRAYTKLKYAQELAKKDKPASRIMKASAAEDYAKFIALMQKSSSAQRVVKLANAHFSRAKILIDLKNFKEAICDLTSFIELSTQQLKLDPENSKIKNKIGEAHYKKGLCYRLCAQSPYSGEFDSAIEEFTCALEFIPDSANIHYRRAQLYTKRNVKAAIEDLETAVKLTPERPHYWEMLGSLLIISENEEDKQYGYDCIAKAVQLKTKQ